MQSELLTTDELSARIKYDVRTIRERLKDSVLIEGVHYIRPFGGRKILFVWERIAEDMMKSSAASLATIPMANGGVLHG
jgi:hypothetical protein